MSGGFHHQTTFLAQKRYLYLISRALMRTTLVMPRSVSLSTMTTGGREGAGNILTAAPNTHKLLGSFDRARISFLFGISLVTTPRKVTLESITIQL